MLWCKALKNLGAQNILPLTNINVRHIKIIELVYSPAFFKCPTVIMGTLCQSRGHPMSKSWLSCFKIVVTLCQNRLWDNPSGERIHVDRRHIFWQSAFT